MTDKEKSLRIEINNSIDKIINGVVHPYTEREKLAQTIEKLFAISDVSGSLLSFEDIINEAKRVKENIKVFPFHDVSFQHGAEWSRDTLIEEIERRKKLIISEPDGIVRETMIANLLVGLQ